MTWAPCSTMRRADRRSPRARRPQALRGGGGLEVPESSSGISIERCNSVERGEELKMLFHRNGYPEFAAVFDRAYAHAYAAGGASWIARDAAGLGAGHPGGVAPRFPGRSRARPAA